MFWLFTTVQAKHTLPSARIQYSIDYLHLQDSQQSEKKINCLRSSGQITNTTASSGRYYSMLTQWSQWQQILRTEGLCDPLTPTQGLGSRNS